MRKNFYLQHSLTAAYDPRMDNLIEKEGMKGYGAYWYIMEKLELMPETRATLDYMQPFCRRRGVSFKYLQKIIFEYDLFIIDEEGFFMPDELNPIRGNNRDFSKNNKSNPDLSKNIEKNIESNIGKPIKTVEKRAKKLDKSTENDAKLTENDAKSTENEQKKAENLQKLPKNDAEESRKKSPNLLNTNDLHEFIREYIENIRDIIIIITTTEKEKEKNAAADDNPDIRSPQQHHNPSATGRNEWTKSKCPMRRNEACQQGKRTWFPTETSLIFRQNEWHFQPKRAAFRVETNGISDGNERHFRPGRTPLQTAARRSIPAGDKLAGCKSGEFNGSPLPNSQSENIRTLSFSVFRHSSFRSAQPISASPHPSVRRCFREWLSRRALSPQDRDTATG